MTDPNETGRTALVRELASELNEVTEMLTAATDTAMQRGKTIDDIRWIRDFYKGFGDHDHVVARLTRVLDGVDGG